MKTNSRLSKKVSSSSSASSSQGVEPEVIRAGRRAEPVGRDQMAVVMTVPLQVKKRAKVKLQLSRRNNANVIDFAKTHDSAIEGNEHFPYPVPEPEVFRDKLAELEQVNQEYEWMRLALQALAEKRDQIRAEFDAVFTLRGTYVEMQSGGKLERILEVALPVKSLPKKLGQLPPPVALRVELGSVPGEMFVRWNGVTGARAYLLESCAVEDDGARRWRLVKVGGRKVSLKERVAGTGYAFRVAAVGGKGGRSPWSPVVERVAG